MKSNKNNSAMILRAARKPQTPATDHLALDFAFQLWKSAVNRGQGRVNYRGQCPESYSPFDFPPSQ